MLTDKRDHFTAEGGIMTFLVIFVILVLIATASWAIIRRRRGVPVLPNAFPRAPQLRNRNMWYWVGGIIATVVVVFFFAKSYISDEDHDVTAEKTSTESLQPVSGPPKFEAGVVSVQRPTGTTTGTTTIGIDTTHTLVIVQGDTGYVAIPRDYQLEWDKNLEFTTHYGWRGTDKIRYFVPAAGVDSVEIEIHLFPCSQQFPCGKNR